MSNQNNADLQSAFDNISNSEGRTVYAKVHALDIHMSRETPEDQRPRISDSVPEISHRMAHDSLNTALKYLFEYEGYRPEDENLRRMVRESFLLAAQHLEKLYLNRPENTPGRMEELYNSALAYYLAGHSPRAFVIMRGITHFKKRLNDHQLMRSMFLRDLPTLRKTTLSRLSQRAYEDEFLAKTVKEGQLSGDEAVEEALRHTLNKIYLLFYEFARTGATSRIENALDLATLGYQVALDHQLSNWWWLFQCTKALLLEYRECSLWSCLRPMLNTDTTGLVEGYIRLAFNRAPIPILELWSSQQHALNYLYDRQSYCLKMPTSSGKTRIAELAVLQFLIETQNESEKKCLYVAPYRALAVEVEDTFKQGFSPLGIRVSQLYGSFDLNPAEFLLAEEAKVLIGTPEKLDAFLRYTPLVADQIGLVIVDEGHIIDSGDRGLRYELFIHRLVRRYEREGIRMLFISAVMPNVEQFSKWITGREADKGVIGSNWRASQQMLGILSWNGHRGRVDYLYRDLQPLDQDFFITNYFLPLNSDDLIAAKCEVKKFPPDKATRSTLIALAALKAVSEGTTLIFAPQPRLVETSAKAVLAVVNLVKQINLHFGRQQDVIPVSANTPDKRAKLNHAILYAQETTGSNSLIVRALQCGVVVHHANVPRALRVYLEELVRDGIVHLVIATNTLAQGVNLPVKTILIHSLSQGKKQKVKPRDFWNICGRAGRASIETEGEIFLLVDTTQVNDTAELTTYEEARTQLRLYVQQATSEHVVSAIRYLLDKIVEQWNLHYPSFGHPDMSALCDRLASGDETWLQLDQKRQLRILDTQLLALIEELQLDNCTVENIAEVFKDSMLYLQLTGDRESKVYFTYENAVSLIVQRINRISHICQTPAKRRRFYQMGISISDCVFIEMHRQELVDFLEKTRFYMGWTPEERADYVIALCEQFLMQLEDVRQLDNESVDSGEGKQVPEFWPHILKLWLLGQVPEQIVEILKPQLPQKWQNAMKISTLIDELCEFRLPWGLNAVSMYLLPVYEEGVEEEDEFEMPEVVSYFASNLRFGVHCPVASIMIASGLSSRKAALSLSQFYEGEVEPRSIFRWLRSISEETIYQCTQDFDLQALLLRFTNLIQTTNDHSTSPEIFEEFSVELRDATAALFPLPGQVLVTQIEGNNVRLFDQETLSFLGTVELYNGSLIEILKSPNAILTFVDAYVDGIATNG